MPTQATPMPAAAADVVLDTNTLLDLLLFDDPRARPLGLALQTGRLRALATQPMFDELADVLLRPFVAGWSVDGPTVAARAQGLCRLVEPRPTTVDPAPRCADADDQKFIDLAWAWPARWLISRDRALLDLARPALARGLHITTPAGWAAVMDGQSTGQTSTG